MSRLVIERITKSTENEEIRSKINTIVRRNTDGIPAEEKVVDYVQQLTVSGEFKSVLVQFPLISVSSVILATKMFDSLYWKIRKPKGEQELPEDSDVNLAQSKLKSEVLSGTTDSKTDQSEQAKDETLAEQSESSFSAQYPITHKILSNPVLANQLKLSQEIAARPSLCVVLLNVVLPNEDLNDREIEELQFEIRALAIKELIKLEEIRTVLSLGKIFIKFPDLHASMNFQYRFNGSRFDSTRTVCAGFYPLDYFLAKKYSI
jgi:hypothetical protein